jgi:hypothetical protein
VDPKVSSGAWAAVGSLLGLFTGSLAGGLLTRGRKKTALTTVLPAFAGTAAGAFLGAALSAPTSAAGTGTAGLPAGVGALRTGLGPSEGTKALPRNLGEPARFDGRYQKAGVEPPHKCTAKSADAIAQQLPGAPWRFAGNWDDVSSMRESSATISTPRGQKTIPYWTDNLLPGGGRNRGMMPMHLSIQCPFTGERWHWFRSLST